MIKSQLKRAILSKRFLFIIFIGIIIHFSSGYNKLHQYLFFDFNAPDIQNQADARAMVQKELNKYSVWFSLLYLYTPLMPILAAFPFSFSYIDDLKSGVIKYIDIRYNHTKYLFEKLLVNGVAGGIALSLPTIISTIIVSIFFNGNINDFSGKGMSGGVFSNLVIYNFYLYIAVHIFIEFIFGFAYSSIALAVSSFIRNTIAVMLSPFLFWVGGDLLFNAFNIQQYVPTSINQFYLTPKVTLTQILVELIVITFISFSLFILKAGKRNIYG